MKGDKFFKASTKGEKDSNFFNYCHKNNFKNVFPYSNIPYRSECNLTSDNLQWINIDNNNQTDSYTYLKNSISNISHDLIIYPAISYLNVEKCQENNNYYINRCPNRLSHSVEYTKKYLTPSCSNKRDKEGITFSHWDQCTSHINKTFNADNADRTVLNVDIKSALCNQELFAPQFYKAETILNNNLQKHLSSNMENKITSIPLCKPPLSPFTSTLVRHQKLMNLKNEEYIRNKDYEIDNRTTDKIVKKQDLINSHCEFDQFTESNDIECGIKENECEYESDFCEKAEEMELLDNLDSEVITDGLTEDIDGIDGEYDSASEEMLEEVHRLFHSSSLNGSKSPFIHSLFSNISPVIRFVREGESVSSLPRYYQSKLKWKLSSLTPNVVKRAAKRSGFKLITKGSQWLGYFGRHMKLMGFKSILEHQKFNHLPGSFQIGRKDRLWRNVSVLASKNGKGKEFNFLPKTYCLPGDLRALKQAWDEEDSLKKARWILKPPASARGIGVKVICKWSQIPKKRPAIVQSYIARPFLIDGSKFDLRIYVAVTSCDPLRIYVHKDGLARFASHKYSKSSKSISNRFIHLTNYSVNKKNENYTSNENHEKCQGHKWSLKALWKYMEEDLHIDWKPIWKNIKDCIVKTIISVESNINSNIKMYCAQKNSVYELFGFDVLLDNKLKPWVIEVNVSPSLHSNSPLDIDVKSGMIADLFNLIGFQLFHTPDDFGVIPLSQSRRPSLSASSIPNYMSNLERTHLKSTPKQSSLSSLNKSSRKSTNAKRNSKFMDKDQLENSQSHDPLPTLQSRDNSITSKDFSRSALLKRKKTSMSLISNTDDTSQSSQDIVDPSLFQQSGFYNRQLTANEKLKHIYYIQKGVYENQSLLSTITEKLTIDDARILIESLDEFNRSGDFELIFPSLNEDSDKYITYINNNGGSRYYNFLLHEFIKRFRANDCKKDIVTDYTHRIIRMDGIKLLEKYSKLFGVDESTDLWTNPCIKDFTRNISKFRSSSAGTLSSSK